MSKPITLYDIPCSKPGSAWSPNTWKARYCLNYKGLSYQTVWVEYPDIETVSKKIGALPTGEMGGKPYYSLPAIHDPNTDTTLSDSALIAEYLDTKYPDTPKLFPRGSHALQYAFESAFMGKLSAAWNFVIPEAVNILNPPSVEYFERTRKEWYGKKLADWVPTGQAREEEWAKVKAGLGAVDKWFQMGEKDGPFVLGEEPGFADFVVISFVAWFRRMWGADSTMWKELVGWSDGRWSERIQRLERYEKVV